MSGQGRQAFGMIPGGVLADRRINMAAKVTYGAVAIFHNPKRGCFASQEAIAEAAGTSVRVVQRATRDLSNAGWITVTRQGQARPNLIRLVPLDPTKLAGHPDLDPTKLAGHSPVDPPSVTLDPTKLAGLDPTKLAGPLENRQRNRQEQTNPGEREDSRREDADTSGVVLTLVQPSDPSPTSRRNGDLFVALAETCGIDWQHRMPKSARAVLNAKVQELATIETTPDEIRGKGASYRAAHPTWTLTPGALVKYWPSLTIAEPEPEWVEPPGVRAVREAQEADERLRRDDPEEWQRQQEGVEELLRNLSDHLANVGRPDYGPPAAKPAAVGGDDPDDIPY